MSSTTSSHRRTDKVTSDDRLIGFDLLSNLTHMAVLTLGTLPRNQVMDSVSRLNLQTAVVFEDIQLLAQRLGYEYTRAFQLVSDKVNSSGLKSLLLRFAAAISSGESEKEFVAQEAASEGERYANEYERSVENLRKWTDAYAAILISVTLIMVVSLVSTLIGSLNQYFILIMAFGFFFMTSIGVYIIAKVAPGEKTLYSSPRSITNKKPMGKLLFWGFAPLGVMAAALLAPRFGLLPGAAVAFISIGVSLFPVGVFAWKENGRIQKLDDELPTFLRSVGNVAGASGVTLHEALNRIDTKSMGSLETHIDRLNIRLGARLPSNDCWEAFKEETGSELVSRATHMLVEGSELGGQSDKVGDICSSYALNVTQLRTKRAITASTFSFLTLPMHATMAFILVFVLQIVSSFSTKLADASSEIPGTEGPQFNLPENLATPPGITMPTQGGMGAGLDIFGAPDMTLVTFMIVMVVGMLTLANSLAPKFASGGSNFLVLSYFSVMSIVSGLVLGIVPIVTAFIFAV